jgi:hypothetical protein
MMTQICYLIFGPALSRKERNDMAKSPEVIHLEKAVSAAQKALQHVTAIETDEFHTEAETEQRRPEEE